MAGVATLQARYDKGMRQDEARALLPKGAVWNLLDYIPNLGAPLGKRGGWSYASPALSTAMSSAIETMAVCHAGFSGAPKLLAWSDNGKMAYITSVSSATLIGTCQFPAQTPVMLSGKLIIPAHDGSSAVQYYDGTTLGTLAGSPPAGSTYCAVYKDFLLLAKGDKVYISTAGDAAATWDTTVRWLRFGDAITGLAALSGFFLVFMREKAARVRGGIPPSAAAGSGDMIKDDPIINVGCIDARSIVVDRGQVIFANKSGVYMSNGSVAPEDLTASCGAKKLWQTAMSGYVGGTLGAYDSTRYTVSAGLHQGRNEYHVCIMDAETFVDYFVFNLQERTFRRCTNIPATMFATYTGAPDELYFSQRTAPRVNKLSTTYTPSATYKNDGNGTAVTPIIEYPFYRDPGKKTWRWMYLDADLRDSATDNPYLSASVIRDPDGSYAALGTTFAETSAKTRRRFAVRGASDGLGVRLVQTNASATTKLYELGAVVHAREPSRL